MFRKAKSVVEGDLKNVGMGLKRGRELNKKKMDWRLVGDLLRMKKLHILFGLGGRHQYLASAPIESDLFVWPPLQ